MTAARPAVEAVRHQVRIAGGGIVALALLAPLAIVAGLAAAGTDPDAVLGEARNPLAWLSSLLLLAVALVAYCNGASDPARPRVWLAFALGFVFLALDERFELHEALRAGLFRPARLFAGTFIDTGDVGLALYFAVGLACSWPLYRQLRRHPPAGAAYIGALVASSVVVVVSMLDPDVLEHWPAPDSWNATFDAVAKVYAEAFFLGAFLVVLDRQLSPGRPGSNGGP